MQKADFDVMVSMVIDNLEGGYYHPKMLADGRVKDSRFGNSGETMFGIDRKNGGDINTSDAGVQFWSIIDSQNASNNWAWNYKGGAYGDQLKSLVSEMMYPTYEDMAQTYLSPTAQAIVESDPKLLFNFVYATWNGSGWFKRFANDFNGAVDSGITDTNQLTQVALDSRLNSSNSLISDSGKHIQKMFNGWSFSFNLMTEQAVAAVKKNPKIIIIGILGVVGVVAIGFGIYEKFIKK